MYVFFYICILELGGMDVSSENALHFEVLSKSSSEAWCLDHPEDLGDTANLAFFVKMSFCENKYIIGMAK